MSTPTADLDFPAPELVWAHHYEHGDGSGLCEWSGHPVDNPAEVTCPSGHEVKPVEVLPLLPAGGGS